MSRNNIESFLETMDSNQKISTESEKDPMVHQPSHYTIGGIETIDAIQAKLTPREFIGAMKYQIMKYTMRASYKNKERQDLEKAEFYNKRLTEYIRNLDNIPPV